MISHTAYFGDGTYTFTLTDTIIEELQHKTGVGIGALFLRMSSSQFRVADIVEVIRLGLIGAGANPQEAQRLVDAYAKNRPFGETLLLALDILDARWNGKDDAASFDLGETDDDFPAPANAALTGDMAEAVNESLKGVGLDRYRHL